MIGPGPVLRDRRHRRIDVLRLSVTDRCNLRCRYCLPAAGSRLAPPAAVLDDRQLLMVAEAAVALGIRKIRVTGGEPLVRPGIAGLVGRLAPLPGLEHLALTSNGLRLADLASTLAAAGLRSVNVSCDSLRPERFAAITRGGELDRCLAGIAAARAAGLEVKINVVVMRGVNDDELLDFAALAQELAVPVRFIEFMPTRGRADGRQVLPSREVLARLAAAHSLTALPRDPDDRLAGPARYWRLGEGPGTVGVIAPVSHRFCRACNRIRVSAGGQVHGCLFRDEPAELLPWLRAGDREGLARALADAAWSKPDRHDLAADGTRPGGETVPMARLGG
jgi:cyclic pyranopterin phosphate synthase